MKNTWPALFVGITVSRLFFFYSVSFVSCHVSMVGKKTSLKHKASKHAIGFNFKGLG